MYVNLPDSGLGRIGRADDDSNVPKHEQSPQQVPIYSIGMQAIQISLTMKNANFFGAGPRVCAETAGLRPRTFGVFFEHSK